jgi:hypothetical protein
MSLMPLTALSSHAAHAALQGKWTEDLGCHLVSCDEEGGIAVYEALTGGEALLRRISCSSSSCSVHVGRA